MKKQWRTIVTATCFFTQPMNLARARMTVN